MKKIVFFLPVICIGLVKCKNGSGKTTGEDTTPPPSSIPVINYTAVNVLPHDTSFFTEGLEFYKGQLLESSGGDLEASPFPSAMGIVDMKKGKVDIKIILDKSMHFGEGITVFNNKLYMLTWKSGIGFMYDATSFKKIKEFPLPSKEGWGLTHDSTSLIMSDGTSNLYFMAPETLRLLNILRITDNNGPVPNINELEYIDGYIYANQWLTSYIFKIDPSSGKVLGRLDLSSLVKNAAANNEDPNWNGIAYDSATRKIYVTGKKWHSMYEIKLL